MARDTPTPKDRRRNVILLSGGLLLLAGAAALLIRASADTPAKHQDITTTIFWVGEGADPSNRYIHNRSSTWVADWVGAYGGVDDPENRCGHLPCGFTPRENAFYFALPYNDLDETCVAKPSQRDVPWYSAPQPAGNSIIKNQWVKISYQDKTAFAQWEDAGPFGEDDTGYVFGSEAPQAGAGLDVSPAVAFYLKLNGEDKTAWEFVRADDVPDGPWRQTVTATPPDCAK